MNSTKSKSLSHSHLAAAATLRDTNIYTSTTNSPGRASAPPKHKHANTEMSESAGCITNVVYIM